ncbi:hypothetical protein HMPREF3150_01424 [Pseudomonas aeruginosa]|nr:hypothetical protein HMPREF3150_01424 [Pseudomonas aeruginosa]
MPAESPSTRRHGPLNSAPARDCGSASDASRSARIRNSNL